MRATATTGIPRVASLIARKRLARTTSSVLRKSAGNNILTLDEAAGVLTRPDVLEGDVA